MFAKTLLKRSHWQPIQSQSQHSKTLLQHHSEIHVYIVIKKRFRSLLLLLFTLVFTAQHRFELNRTQTNNSSAQISRSHRLTYWSFEVSENRTTVSTEPNWNWTPSELWFPLKLPNSFGFLESQSLYGGGGGNNNSSSFTQSTRSF